MHEPNVQKEGRRRREFELRVIREPAFVPMSERKREICWNFGIPPREQPFVVVDQLSVTLGAGSIVLLFGPSGSGKSSVLRAIAEQAEGTIRVGGGKFPTEKAIVDAIAPSAELGTALEILTACGLGEPRLWIRRFSDLSDGERFRASLARAVGASLCGDGDRPILCDEFTAILHRRMARAVAYNLRKLVRRHGLTLVVATTHADIIDDLQPDQTIRLGAGAPTSEGRQSYDKVVSLRRRAVIEEGSVRDYRLFGPMHYRHRDGLGFVDKVFLLRESARSEPLGILVFAHAPLELALRNRSTEGRFLRNSRRLNRELRILRRLVMHPDVRGCGLGHWFVANTLPRVGVRFVECLAAMGAVNPVFEKAGMNRVGRCPLPRGRAAMLKRMRDLKVDPFSSEFPSRIGRCPRVRRLVLKTIEDWLEVMQGAAKYRIEGREPMELALTFRQLIGEPPIYFLWDREGVYPRRRDEASVGRSGDPSSPFVGRADPDDGASGLRTRQSERRHRPSRDGSEDSLARHRPIPDHADPV
jgi:ABC-type lipoprotein export system ATPase subunit